MRIASLLPSATEIVYTLGLADQLVGVTFECDYPADPRQGRRVLVGGLDTRSLDTAAIDTLVRQKAAAGEDLYRFDEEALRAAAPDVVLTQDLCGVCALPSGDADAALARPGCAATVVTLDPHTLDEVLATILAVGKATGTAARAATVVTALRERIDAVRRSVADRPRPRVFVLEWPDPPFAAGHWVPDLVDAAGGDAVLGRRGKRSVPTTWDDVTGARPQIVMVGSCGFGMAGTRAHALGILDQLPPDAAVWAMDANAVLVRPGPRVVDGIEGLAAILHGAGTGRPDLAQRVR